MDNKSFNLCVLLLLLLLALWSRFLFDTSKLQREFTRFLVRVNKHTSIIASNSSFKNALLSEAYDAAEKFLSDNIQNHSTPLLNGFHLINKDKEVLSSAVSNSSGITYSGVRFLFHNEVEDLKSPFYNEQTLLIFQPIFDSEYHVVGSLNIDQVKKAFNINKFEYSDGAIKIKTFNGFQIIRQNILVYILITSLWLSIISAIIYSVYKIRLEVARHHSCIRHEFNDLLYNISQTLGLIPRAFKKQDTSRVLALAEDAKTHTDWALRLSNQLGYTIRKSNMSLEAVSLKDVEASIVRDSFIIYNELFLDLKTSFPDNVLVLVDKSFLDLLLINLIKNAMNHKCKKSCEVILTCKADNDYAYLHMENQGNIPLKIQRKIFKAGVKGPNSKGSGLGLYYSKKLAHLMGGSLSLSAQKPNTVIFILKLPIYKR